MTGVTVSHCDKIVIEFVRIDRKSRIGQNHHNSVNGLILKEKVETGSNIKPL